MAGQSVDREIKISASDNGVNDKLARLRESALALGRGMAEDAKKQANSSRELIKYMNDEIALLEKRNKLEREGRELKARDNFDQTGDKSALNTELQKISIESREDKHQTDILKSILEAIKQTSTREINADRENVKRQLRSDRQIDAMDDHEEAIKQTFQKQMIKDTEPTPQNPEPTPQEQKQNTSNQLANLQGFLKTGDSYSTAMFGTADLVKSKAPKLKNGLARGLANSAIFGLPLAGMMIQMSQGLFEGQGDIWRAIGGDQGKIQGFTDDLADNLDMTDAQASSRSAEFMGSSAGKFNLNTRNSIKNLLAVDRYGVDANLLASTRKFTTGNVGDNVLELFGLAQAVRDDRGLGKGAMGNLIGLNQQLVEQQFMATGRGYAGTNMGIINRMLANQQASGKQMNVDRARNTIQGLDSAIRSQGSEQLEAFQFGLFEQSGGGGYFDYLLEKDKGITGKIGKQTVDEILKSNMSPKQQAMSIMNAFKGQITATQAYEIVQGGGVGALNLKNKEGTGIEQVAEAEGMEELKKTFSENVAINPIRKSSASVEDIASEGGQALVNSINKLIENLSSDKSTFDVIKEWLMEDNNETKKSNSYLKEIVKNTGAGGATGIPFGGSPWGH